MGEVYRARDTKLSRDVAIKVLPASFAADADRLKRFEQEARTAGALNHPNLVTVFELGTIDDGAPYIVMELVEGETLRQRLTAAAACAVLPIRKASTSRCRSPAAWPPRTTAASCIAISSRRT